MAADARRVWVVGGYDHALWRLDADGVVRLKVRFEERFPLRRAGYERWVAGIALSPGSVWLTHGDEVSHLDPATGEVRWSIRAGGRWQGAAVSDGETIWVGFNDTARGLALASRPGQGDSARFGPDPASTSSRSTPARSSTASSSISTPSEMILASGGVWIALAIPGLVSQLVDDGIQRTVPAGNEPVGLGVRGRRVVGHQPA